MNDIFSLRRFCAFALKWYKEIGIIRLCIAWTILLLVMCVSLCDFNQGAIKEVHISKNYEHLEDLLGAYTEGAADLYRKFLYFIVFATTLFCSWKIFGNVKMKTTWLLPVSKFEKLTFVAINALLVNVVIFTVLFYVAISVVSSYEYVALQDMAGISVEEIQEYGDDTGNIELTEYEGITYRKIYADIGFSDFLNVRGPMINTKITTDIKTYHSYHYHNTTYGWISILIAFSIALWIGVSPYHKSWIVAFIIHICLTWLPIIVFGTIYMYMFITKTMSSSGLDFYSETTYGMFNLFLASKIYYLFPIAYLCIAWRKIKTMQMNERGIMKRYDLFLLALYIISVTLISMGAHSYSSKKTDASIYFGKLENQSVKIVVIENTGINLRIIKKEDFDKNDYHTKRESEYGEISKKSSADMSHSDFKLKGDISLSSISAFRVDNDTLFISKAKINKENVEFYLYWSNNFSGSGAVERDTVFIHKMNAKVLELHLRKHVKVDTLNAPNVTIVNE